jgi:hypothetical protein
VLVKNELRGRVGLQADGQMRAIVWTDLQSVKERQA